MSGKTVRVIRLYHGLSQAEFSKQVGLSQQLISKVENGELELSHKTKIKILKHFKVSTEIIDLEEEIT
ncbi:helix-turn-helix transcriptional regulator [Virgibacillus necropolis]|uniref:HTH cro/C1-type domain-containing protein n=1 Tax=Virgibacillus necropolis TaxID=163877 RepID=A0A221MGS0_9BACI|nr:helix-turn-helix transcriptional regulator [Virgibacillus necropolis]ASN06846.1 hypothetical protein CFK40_18375 [Virgibacillus necropolis]